MASFTFSPSSPAANQAVQFTDTSSGSPTSWYWTFGDGGTSTTRNPSHSFGGTQTYTVSLTVSNSSGSNYTTRSVVVGSGGGGALSANFTWTPQFPAVGQTVQFTDTSTGTPAGYSWQTDFYLAQTKDASYAFPDARIYTVYHSVVGSGPSYSTSFKRANVVVGGGRVTDTGVAVTTLAGAEPFVGPPQADGQGTAASFASPSGVAVDLSGNIFVADYSKVRKVSASGAVTTLAGGGTGIGTDGQGAAASFGWLRGVAVDASGNVYVTDPDNYKIRKITPSGMVSTLAGSGSQGSVDGVGGGASFHGPEGIAIDPSGML